MDEYNSYQLLHDVVDLSNQSLDSGAVKQIESALLKKPAAIALDLGWNSLGDDGVVALVDLLLATPGCRRLLSIDLWRNGVGPRGGQALAKLLRAPHCSLTSLNLRKNEVGVPGAVAILEALRSAPAHKVTSLDLTLNDLAGPGGEAATALSTPLGPEALTPAALQRLILALSPPAISVAQTTPKGDSAHANLPALWMSTVEKQYRLDSASLSLATVPVYEGMDSAVFKAQRWTLGRTASEEVAVKVFRASLTDAAITDVARRYAALRAHSRFVGVYQRAAGERCVVTAWAAHGSLAALFDRDAPLHLRAVHGLGPLYRRVRVCVDVAKALRDLHTSQRLAHAALQPRAVLLDDHFRARLGGLRHAVDLAAPAPSAPRPRPPVAAPYVAPEVLAGHSPSAASDVFSFGAVCRAVLAVPSSSSASAFSLSGDGAAECPAHITALLARCLGPDPAGRPDISTLATTLREWLRQLMAPPEPVTGASRSSTGLSSVPEDVVETDREFPEGDLQGDDPAVSSPLRLHSSSTLRPDASFGEARRVLSMWLPLGGTLAHRSSISRQPSDRSRSGSTYEVSSEAEQRLGRALNSLFDRMEGYEEHLASTHDLLCQLLPVQECAAQITHVTRSLADVYAKLETLERSYQSTAAKPRDDCFETPVRKRSSLEPGDEVTFLELRDHRVQLSGPAATTPGKGAGESEVERLVKALVRVEVEKVQQQFTDRLQAIESLTITQFQQLASKQLQLESQMQHFVAKCDPSAKKGRVKLPCETKLTELQEEVTTLRQQLQQSVEKIQQQLHASSTERPGLRGRSTPEAGGPSGTVFPTRTTPETRLRVAEDPHPSLVEPTPEATAASKKKTSGHVSWERSPRGGHARLKLFSPRSNGVQPEGSDKYPPPAWPMAYTVETHNVPTAADYCVDRCRLHEPKGWLSNPLSSRTDNAAASVGGARLTPPPGAHLATQGADSPSRSSARSLNSSVAGRSVLGSLVPKRSSGRNSSSRTLTEEAAADDPMSRQPSAVPESARSDTRRAAATRIKVPSKEAAARPRPSSPEERAASVRRGSVCKMAGPATAAVAVAAPPPAPAAPASHRLLDASPPSTRSHLPHFLLKR